MPRVLLVPAPERASELIAGLLADGNPVRAIARDDTQSAAAGGAGAEVVQGDPDRIMTLMPSLAATTVVCWLLGDDATTALHDERLTFFLEKIVDTPVRGLVYEAPADAALAATGRAAVEKAAATWNIPVRVVAASDPDWTAATRAAIDQLISGG